MTANLKFLTDGAATYLDALAAIQAYQQTARHICQSVYKKRQPDLMKVGFVDDGPCEDYTYPEPGDELEGPEAELGVCQKSRNGEGGFYVYLRWDGTEAEAPTILAAVSMGFNDRTRRDAYAKQLRNTSSIEPVDDAEYSLWSTREVTDLSTCAETLDALLKEWIEHWPAGRKLK
jgi:hypothetical protein